MTEATTAPEPGRWTDVSGNQFSLYVTEYRGATAVSLNDGADHPVAEFSPAEARALGAALVTAADEAELIDGIPGGIATLKRHRAQAVVDRAVGDGRLVRRGDGTVREAGHQADDNTTERNEP